MSGKTAKRKEVEQSSSDEIEPGRQKKYRRTGRYKVTFAPTVQAISFDKHQKPISILGIQPTYFPTALKSPDREKSPSAEPSTQPEKKTFTLEPSNETSKMATTSKKKKQPRQDLATTRKELQLAKNENRNLSRLMNMYRNLNETTDRALKDMTKRVEDAEAELEAIFRTNDRLIDMLRVANETVEKVQCQVVIDREEKTSEREKGSTRACSK